MSKDLIQNEEVLLVEALRGDERAFASLVEPLRQPLFFYIYRMVTHRENAEDLLQEILLRVFQSLPKYRREARFKTWLYGIATHVCLDYLRQKNRWRVDAQLRGEQETDGSEDALEALAALMSQPDFQFEIREHIAFCFSCIARTLPPEEQAAIMLKEILGFTAQEAAKILECSEPVFRHRLTNARRAMTGHYDNLCQLINKTGVCHQCQSLREFAPAEKRGEQFVQIQVKPGIAVTPENLFSERIEIVRRADLKNGKSRELHDVFFADLSEREQEAGR